MVKAIAVVIVSVGFLSCHAVPRETDRSQTAASNRTSAGGLETVEYGELLTRNTTGLTKLSLGMDKSQVLSTMGTFQSEIREGMVSNPYKSEMITKGADVYEILYYMTANSRMFQGLRDSESTPVVLKNGKVAGWGWGMANSVANPNPSTSPQ